MARWFTLVLVGVATLAGASLALAESTHSGLVTAVAATGQTITIDELGCPSSRAVDAGALGLRRVLGLKPCR